MFMNPSNSLKKEIQCIRKMLSVLSIVCEQLEKGESIDTKDLKKMINFFRTYVDSSHNQKEESILFPQLEQHCTLEEEFRIESLRKSNEAGRHYIEEIRSAIQKLQKGDVSVIKKIKRLSKKYMDVEAKHLNEETQYLFPMIHEYLDEKTQNSVEHEFKKLDNELYGSGKIFHEAMKKILNQLTMVYAGADSKN